MTPVELLDDEVEPAERGGLESLELLVEVLPRHRHGGAYPNFPVTYSSVRESPGFEKIFSVGACSTSSPRSMNAVVSATRAACCMLCVTITIV